LRIERRKGVPGRIRKVEDGDVRASRGERLRVFTSEPPGAAGDDGNFAGEVEELLDQGVI
jgi:hypothetical protein